MHGLSVQCRWPFPNISYFSSNVYVHPPSLCCTSWPLLFLISLCWHTDSVELPGNSPSCPTEYDCVLFRELLDSVFFCGIYRDFGHLGWWTIEYIWGIHYLYTLLSAFVRHVVFIWLFIYFVLTGSSCSKGLKCSCDARLE